MVAPHEGAWIEIACCLAVVKSCRVAPHEGAWIEIMEPRLLEGDIVVAPHEGAWIEMLRFGNIVIAEGSHPTRVRGLKFPLWSHWK